MLRPPLLVLLVLLAGCTTTETRVAVTDANGTVESVVEPGVPTTIGRTRVYVGDGSRWTPEDPPARPPQGERAQVILRGIEPMPGTILPTGVVLTLLNIGDTTAVLRRADLAVGERTESDPFLAGEELPPGGSMRIELRSPGRLTDVDPGMVARVAFENAAEVRGRFTPRAAWRIEPQEDVRWGESGIESLRVVVHNDGNFPVTTRDFRIFVNDHAAHATAEAFVPAGSFAVVTLRPVFTGFPREQVPVVEVTLDVNFDDELARGRVALPPPQLVFGEPRARVSSGCHAAGGWCELENVSVEVENLSPTPVSVAIGSVRVGDATHQSWESGALVPGRSTTLVEAAFHFADVDPGASELLVEIVTADGGTLRQLVAPFPRAE